MNRTHRIVPTYTGDVSGACSALFELGGMVVIHDPSGCNSTYNTHDETRWYDHDSLIFISGLVERDAVLGNDDKFVRDVVRAARELHPRFVALCNSPIPYISGTDFPALARMIEGKTGIPTFYVRTNGMHDYVVGAGNAFGELARRFVAPATPRPGALNVLGVTPLDFLDQVPQDAMESFAEEAGFEVVSCWAMGSTLDDISRAAEASVNLVVSATGLSAARVLRQRFGTPYVVGRPTEAFGDVLASSLRKAESDHECSKPCREARTASPSVTRVAVGEPVAMGSAAVAHKLATGEDTRVVCPLEGCSDLLCPTDVAANGEEEIERALAHASVVVADALYAPIVPASARLVPAPHHALSGRQASSERLSPLSTSRSFCLSASRNP